MSVASLHMLPGVGERRRRGRPRVTGIPEERAKHLECARLMLLTNWPVKKIARFCGCSRATAYNWLGLALGYDDPEADDLRRVIGSL